MPPNHREPLDPTVSLWNFLAWQLRFEREKHGLSLAQWGKIINVDRSTACNMEAGRHKIDDYEATAIDRRFNTGRLYELLLRYARLDHDPEWLRTFIRYERTATSIKVYHGQAIPGPLQTDDYTRALLQGSGIREIDSEMTERIARKHAIWDREHPPIVWALMDESVLACPTGGREVMREQLRHLLAMADLPYVIIRIIPTESGPHPGHDGPFQVIGLEGRDVAYSGAQNGGRLIEATGEAKEMSVKFDLIGAKAASEAESRALIEQYLERLE